MVAGVSFESTANQRKKSVAENKEIVLLSHKKNNLKMNHMVEAAQLN